VLIDATILIPTFNHADLLPYALRSALAQDGVTIEVFVVGDGVGDDTRAALEPFLRVDERVRFFDLPKGERRGERHRHEALREASGEAVCYLGDDDILLPEHVSEMLKPNPLVTYDRAFEARGASRTPPEGQAGLCRRRC
jgi:GalNAc5-diNAcBac-PP-undecaprenol beta-1,3-glucosyltransferase